MHSSGREQSGIRKPFFLSIVFSFRNEADNIPQLIQRLRVVLSKEMNEHRLLNYELIFVNDASSDASKEILLNEATVQSDIKLINMSRPFGLYPCLMAGMSHAKGDAVIYMDTDLQDPPELIHQMLDVWFHQPELDVVHTVREKREGENAFRKWVINLGYRVIYSLSPLRIPVECGDYKLMSRRVIEHLNSFREVQPYFRGIVWSIGFKSAFVPYIRQSRYAGKSKFPILGMNAVNGFFESALISFSGQPLKFVFFSGVIFLFITLGTIIKLILDGIAGRPIESVWIIVLFISVTAFIQFFCLGFMGLYIHMIYQESKKRPAYIIESTNGF